MNHRTLKAAVLVCLLYPLLGCAQPAELAIPSFAGLRQQAHESVDVSIGPFALGLMGWMMDDHDPQSAEAKKILQGLKSVQVRSYQFKSDFLYPQTDVDALRSQLSAPGWSRLVQVRDRNKNENVDVYIALDNQKITGIAIIASEPREFTIVNIVGAIDLEHFAHVQKALGIPATAVVPLAQNVPR